MDESEESVNCDESSQLPIWEDLAATMVSEGMNFTSVQCENKFKYLKKKPEGQPASTSLEETQPPPPKKTRLESSLSKWAENFQTQAAQREAARQTVMRRRYRCKKTKMNYLKR
ncbi:hypothetical protein ACJJTC_010533 [Scirpophaga incertulas]